MSALRAWLLRFADVFRKTQSDRDFAAELQSHLDLHIADHVRAGMNPDEARRRALIALGGVEQTKEGHRDGRGIRVIDELLQDLRFAARLLARHRGFTMTAVLVLGAGIGMSNTFFIMVNASCLRGLSLDQPGRVMDLSTLDKTGRERPMSYLDFEDVRASASSFAAIAAFAPRSPLPVSISDGANAPERVMGVYVSPNIFRLIGDIPVAGRDFTLDDDKTGAPSVVMLGRSLWEQRYHRDPSVIGQTIRVNGKPALVIGVMPDRSKFPSNAEMWQPLSHMPSLAPQQRDARGLTLLGRLSPDRTVTDACTEVEAVAGRLARDHPDTNKDTRFRVVPVNDVYVATITDPAWLAFIAAGCLLLLVACANVANLLLMHSLTRAREIAVRASLGATRRRIVRQLLAESLLLAGLGGALGLVLSMLGLRLLWSSLPVYAMPYWMAFTVDRRALTILTGVCLASSVIFGAAPALHASKMNVSGLLKDGGRTATKGLRTRRWTSALLVAQFALGTLFLSLVVLNELSRRAVQYRDPDIDASKLVTAAIALPTQKYGTPSERLAFYERLEEALRSAGAIASQTIASSLPFGGAAARRLAIEGRAPGGFGHDTTAPTVWTIAISPAYFETLGLKMVRGRPFNDRDGNRGSESAIVNQRFAEMYFPSADPVGTRIQMTADGAPAAVPPWLTIVGVSPTVRQRDRPDFDPVVYLPYRAEPPLLASLIVRGQSGSDAVASILRKQTSAVDPDLPLFGVMTLEHAIADARWNGRVSGLLAGSISWLAVGLALVGLYAVTAHAVIQHTQEIGVRMALGARPSHLAALTLRRSVLPTGLGMLVGVGCSFIWERMFPAPTGSLRLTDPHVVMSVAVLLIVLAVCACLVPLMRAIRIDPIIALRYE